MKDITVLGKTGQLFGDTTLTGHRWPFSVWAFNTGKDWDWCLSGMGGIVTSGRSADVAACVKDIDAAWKGAIREIQNQIAEANAPPYIQPEDFAVSRG